MEKEKKEIKGYKGFDKDLKCRDFQYEIGKKYHCEKAILCEEGFHFCKNLLDVLYYYPPSTAKGLNRFCKVIGAVDTDGSFFENKIACTDIEIVSEIQPSDFLFEGIWEMAKLGGRYIHTCVVPCAIPEHEETVVINMKNNAVSATTKNKELSITKGTHSIAANTGGCSLASCSSRSSLAANTGYNSFATASGFYAIAANLGIRSVAYTKQHNSAAVISENESSAITEGTGSIASCVASNYSRAVAKNKRSIAASTCSYDSETITEKSESISALTGNDSFSIANGDCSASVSTGNYTSSTAKGNNSVALNMGYKSLSETTGKSSISINTGGVGEAVVKGENSIAIVAEKDGIASGVTGSWLVFVEKDNDGNITDIKPFKVDGKTVIENCYYRLGNGELVKVETTKKI